MMVDSTNSTISFAVSPGTMSAQFRGVNEMMTVGTAKMREKKNVVLQRRMVREWPMPELVVSLVASRAWKPAP